MGIKCKTLYDKIRRNSPYFEDLVTRSIYHSNAIEGNTLSYYNTYAIVFNKNTILSANPREIYEAINLKYALSYVLSSLDNNLTVDMIRKIGILVNKNISDIDNFRSTQVFINGARHIPPKPEDVPRLISELVYSIKKSDFDSIWDFMSYFHIKFERIHPFIDGNGRTGRLLLTKLSMRNGLAPIVIPVEARSKYMELLDTQDVFGLGHFLKDLCNLEKSRMTQFGIVL